MTVELSKEILDEVCRQKGHSWRRTGITYPMNPPSYPEQCKICGKRRTAHEHDEPYRYTYDER